MELFIFLENTNISQNIFKYLKSREIEFHSAFNDMKTLNISQYLLVLCLIFLLLPP